MWNRSMTVKLSVQIYQNCCLSSLFFSLLHYLLLHCFLFCIDCCFFLTDCFSLISKFWTIDFAFSLFWSIIRFCLYWFFYFEFISFKDKMIAKIHRLKVFLIYLMTEILQLFLKSQRSCRFFSIFTNLKIWIAFLFQECIWWSVF